MKFSFCDDLGAPELGVVMDVAWYESVRQELEQWLDERGCNPPIDRMMVIEEAVRMEFILTWA